MIRAKHRPTRVIVTGTIAATPYQGGAAWAVLQYVLGLRELGCEVYLVEPIDEGAIIPPGATLAESSNARYFQEVIRRFGLEQHAALLLKNSRDSIGLTYERLNEIARGTDLLINISGMLEDERLLEQIAVRAYLDLDPAFVQLWHTQGIDMRFDGHTHFVTIGQNIGEPTCAVPVCDKAWIKTVQPIVLSQWPTCGATTVQSLTTVGNWRSYGSITHAGVTYGQKAHSIREIMSLPDRSPLPIRIAMALDPAEQQDIQRLAKHRWQLVDPVQNAGTPDAYQSFVSQSWAELGIAKDGYVKSACGWFSDRSACYLASGKPVIAQDTGFAGKLPTGAGLLSFSTVDEVLAGIDSLRTNYRRHARSARMLAEGYFDSSIVLPKLLDHLGRSA